MERKLGDNYSVTVVAISGGTFNYLAKSLNQLTENFTKEDQVIFIAGCNDCSSTPLSINVDNGFNMSFLKETAKKTNLHVVSIPFRYDRPEYNYRIQCVNGNMLKNFKYLNIKSVIDITSFDRKCFDHRGFHLSKWGKLKLVTAMVKQVVNQAHAVSSNLTQANEDELSVTANVLEENHIAVIDADMNEMFDEFMFDPTLAFAHCISADFAMLRGVAVAFRGKFGRPQPSDYVNQKLTCQTVPNGSSVFGLVTKPLYFSKPTDTDYDIAFRHLEQEFIKKGLRALICSPMGCVRDSIQLEQLARNIINFQKRTGATVCIVCFNERSNGTLRYGLSHLRFMKKLRETIEETIQRTTNAPTSTTESVCFSAFSNGVKVSKTKRTDFLCAGRIDQEKNFPPIETFKMT